MTHGRHFCTPAEAVLEQDLESEVMCRVGVVHLGRSTCHAISGRGNHSTRASAVLSQGT